MHHIPGFRKGKPEEPRRPQKQPQPPPRVVPPPVWRGVNRDIADFLEQVNHPISPSPTENINPLEVLFRWSRAQLDGRLNLKRELAARDSTIFQQSAHISGLKDTIEHLKRSHASQVKDLQRKHEGEVKDLTAQYSGALSEQESMYEGRLKVQEADHYETVDKLVTDYDARIQRLREEHDARSRKLTGQLLVNKSDDKGWPDEILAQRLSKLAEKIVSITSQKEHPELKIPDNQRILSSFDVNGVVKDLGPQYFLRVLRHRIWTILQEELFAKPLGFGALDTKTRHDQLHSTYESWLRLYLGADSPYVGVTAKNYLIFEQSKAANRWRSATFACIAETMKNCDNEAEESANVKRVAAKIEKLWKDVSTLTGNTVPTEIKQGIMEVSQQAMELAFHFGIHPARLELYLPSYGAQVQIGGIIADWRDGTRFAGTKVKVIAVVAPGINRMGDGVRDLDTLRTVTPCRIVSS